MIDRDQWREIWMVLSRNKLRTVLTAFGVFWGIFMMVIMMGAAKGLKNGATSAMNGWSTNSMFMWTQGTSMPYKGFQRGRYFNLRNSDVEAIKEQVNEVDIISPRNQLGGYRGSNNAVRGTRTGAFDLYGDYPEYNKIEKVKLLKGRLLNDGDIIEKRKIAVIGKTVYETLFKDGEEPIGEYIKVKGVNFKVVGLFTSNGADMDEAEEQMRSIYVPFSTFQTAFHLGDKVGWLAITSKPNVPVSIVGEKVKSLLKERHSVHPDDRRAFGSWNMEEEFSKMTGLFTGINGLSLIVGMLTLIAGCIGVSNIMLVIVKERTKELGIRRSIGATPWTVIKQIILESVTLTILAGVFGVLLGVWIMEGVAFGLDNAGANGQFFKNPEVELRIVLFALIVLVTTGLLAGVIPAQRAVSVKPVDALRAE
jgi:putative ABC transport system permease protein